jgi:hypothetical protein
MGRSDQRPWANQGGAAKNMARFALVIFFDVQKEDR